MKRTSVRLERHVIIDYLCGVPIAHTSAATGLGRQVIYRILARHDIPVTRRTRRGAA
ncbi:hypothetical protein [Nocardioides sp.]|uniref:hypothetical protein n=1 Tax=Nocardioides sp. TaxID=35761 RepID=UPI003516F89E